MVKEAKAIPARSSPGLTRTAQNARELGQAAKNGLPEPTEDVDPSRHTRSVGLLGGTSGEGRKKWSKEENKALMKCYYQALEGGRGYMQRLAQEWQLVYPGSCLTAQALAVRKGAIIKQNLLTKLELEEIQRTISQPAPSGAEQQNCDTALAAPEEPTSEPPRQAAGTNLSPEEVGLRDRIVEGIHHALAGGIRSHIPILRGRKQLQAALGMANRVLATMDHGPDISTINATMYATAREVATMVGVKLDRQPRPQTDPPWLQRLARKVEQQRREVNQLQAIKRGEKIKKAQRILLKYHVGPDRSIKEACEDAKQRLIALAARTQKYKARLEQYQQNRTFRYNQRQFYRNLEKAGEGKTAGQDRGQPDKEEMTMYWQEIWSQEKKHNRSASWLQQLQRNHPTQPATTITPEKTAQTLRKMSSWKAPGPDMVHAFWLKKLTSLHPALVRSLNNILNNTEEIPQWMTVGTTHLLLKEGKDSSDPSNYRPITCLPSIWKLLTGILAKEVDEHLTTNHLLAWEQKGCCSNSRGTKDQLLIDKMVMRDSRARKTNLGMGWIDYKKAFDSVPHTWILECLKLYKVSSNITSFVERSMKNWKTNLTFQGTHLGQVTIKSGIFQGDAISPLLFCLAMNPLSELLKESGLGYKIKGGQQINHLLYMDDLKLYAKSERELDSLTQTVRIYSKDIGMTFGLDKCAKVTLRKGKTVAGSDLQLPSGGVIRDIGSGGAYKYLGIEENSVVEHSRMKEKTTKEYIRRTRKLLRSKLSGTNKIRAINTYAVPVLRYSAGIVDWTKQDLQDLDRKTRKQLTMHGALHPRADVDRLYIPRHMGGRGLINIEDMVEGEKLALREYIEQRREDDTLIAAVRHSGEHQRKVEADTTAKAHKESRQEAKYSSWKEKPLHGQYIRSLPDEASREGTYQWLTKGDLKIGTEALITAAQDQAINTRAHMKNILKAAVDGNCRMCGQYQETVDHLVAGCKVLANHQYKQRHNQVAKRVHWALCQKYKITTVKQWWKHAPEGVTETDKAKLLWDFSIRTDNHIQANKPDIVVVDKEEKSCLIIDIACPLDRNIKEKEQEKITKYQDLKREIERLWKVRAKVIPVVVGSLGAVTEKHQSYTRAIDDNISTRDLQKATLLGTAQILREVLQMGNT